MVEPVHQQHRVTARGDDAVDHHPQARHGCGEIAVGVETAGREVTLGQLPGAHRRSVGRAPPVERTELVELGAVAAPVDERIEPEAGEDLGQLGGMTEGVGHIADRRHRAERAGHRASVQQVAHVRLTRRQQRVGLHVPGARREPAGGESGDDLVAPLRPHREVVVEHDRLPVEHEAKARVGRHQIEHRVDGVDQAPAEDLERPVPLPIPMEVGDEQELVRHARTEIRRR